VQRLQCFLQALGRDRHRRAQFLREQRDAQLLEKPAQFLQPGVGLAASLRRQAPPGLQQRRCASRAGSLRSFSSLSSIAFR